MLIAIPVEGKSISQPVASSFGRPPYFLLYNTETKEEQYLDNSAAASQGGAGIKAAQLVVDNHAVAVIVPQCGENAANVLKAAGIELYKAEPGSVEENIEKYRTGTLTLLSEIHPGFHKHS